ncbi:carbohydrate ABC transporter permease [Streptomyces polyrhachis]|uniref:Carbohydrate ABC transporter permease n=1 Tax=Streptomyces polyrhachis TaxID=1282885 RepID=A0ABW2GHB6_9ACTN
MSSAATAAPGGAGGGDPATEAPAARTPSGPHRSVTKSRGWAVGVFLLPALALLGALVAYPIVYSVYRSLFDKGGSSFVGLDNYTEVFTNEAFFTAVRNNLIWVAVAPAVCTALGLIFAVLTERVRWGTAFKLVVFMPMAISMLAAGIIFRLVYESDPDRGVANAMWTTVHDTFADGAPWPGARGRATPNAPLEKTGSDFTTREAVRSGTPALLPVVGVRPTAVTAAQPAGRPAADAAGVTGTVWLDVLPPRAGRNNQSAVDDGEKALAGITVQAVKGGEVVASATTAADGTFALPASADGAHLRLPAANFAQKYNGVYWLGPSVVTWGVMSSYVWMWAGFAMVLIAAGLAAVPRELLEAARVDGATEWQVFRRITVPVLAPVLVVVMVTLMINVLKIFDLVYVIAPNESADEATVLAVLLYNVGIGTSDPDHGIGSAIAVLLLLLVIPVMIVNIRRLRRETRR